MKTLITTIFLISLAITSHAYSIKEFNNIKDAEAYSVKVNGQVFKEQDQELYRVIFGGVKINDIVVLSTYEKN